MSKRRPLQVEPLPVQGGAEAPWSLGLPSQTAMNAKTCVHVCATWNGTISLGENNILSLLLSPPVAAFEKTNTRQKERP